MIIALVFRTINLVSNTPAFSRPAAAFQAGTNPGAPDPAGQIQALTDSAKKAYGKSAKGVWRLQGSLEMHGIQESFLLTFDSTGRYVMSVSGPDAETDGFDGKTEWTVGASRVPQLSFGTGVLFDRLTADMITGAWLNPNRKINLVSGENSSNYSSLEVQLPGSGPLGTVTLDAATHLPASLSTWSGSGGALWTFAAPKTAAGRTFPSDFRLKDGPDLQHWHTNEVQQIKGGFSFKMPGPAEPLALISPKVSPAVPVRRIGGYMFVEPKINGKTVGWFFLDTGAGGMCISPAAASKLDLPKISQVAAVGAVGTTWNPVVEASDFSLGPVSFNHVKFTQVTDIDGFSKYFHIPIAGICGTDFIARATIIIDPRKSTVEVLPQANSVPSSGVHWVSVKFFQGVPSSEFRFQALDAAAKPASGTFTIDTGSGSTVDFCSPAVDRYRLTAGQTAGAASTGGIGGSQASGLVKAAWFKIGDTSIKEPMIGVQYAKTGLFSCPYLAGNIGEGFLSKFILTLDYAHGRIGFTSLASASQH